MEYRTKFFHYLQKKEDSSLEVSQVNLLSRKIEGANNESLSHIPFVLTSHSAFFCLLGILQCWYVGTFVLCQKKEMPENFTSYSLLRLHLDLN